MYIPRRTTTYNADAAESSSSTGHTRIRTPSIRRQLSSCLTEASVRDDVYSSALTESSSALTESSTSLSESSSSFRKAPLDEELTQTVESPTGIGLRSSAGIASRPAGSGSTFIFASTRSAFIVPSTTSAFIPASTESAFARRISISASKLRVSTNANAEVSDRPAFESSTHVLRSEKALILAGIWARCKSAMMGDARDIVIGRAFVN
ncbi:uncharacterized protein SCHCODRAFT_02495817 [Schizophyllum commune H4-8]|uniref:uncharacterized protein n=1 Tax=Schizophyllum commune (strain H4-8 / FGSC 9210) TaxID=578458 RepID=UPI00215FBD0E|nr:uncharacterized protein SCHCODRAFT_02495817 [Schizophyllum commune H4-8]KAI5895547.1 hypothetical protein SCHCODRAFT_02495817 [Schizophyllum commune H4-8]